MDHRTRLVPPLLTSCPGSRQPKVSSPRSMQPKSTDAASECMSRCTKRLPPFCLLTRAFILQLEIRLGGEPTNTPPFFLTNNLKLPTGGSPSASQMTPYGVVFVPRLVCQN